MSILHWFFCKMIIYIYFVLLYAICVTLSDITPTRGFFLPWFVYIFAFFFGFLFAPVFEFHLARVGHPCFSHHRVASLSLSATQGCGSSPVAPAAICVGGCLMGDITPAFWAGLHRRPYVRGPSRNACQLRKGRSSLPGRFLSPVRCI